MEGNADNIKSPGAEKEKVEKTPKAAPNKIDTEGNHEQRRAGDDFLTSADRLGKDVEIIDDSEEEMVLEEAGELRAKFKKTDGGKKRIGMRVAMAMLAATLTYGNFSKAYSAESAAPQGTNIEQVVASVETRAPIDESQVAFNNLTDAAKDYIGDLGLFGKKALVDDIKEADIDGLKDFINTGDQDVFEGKGDNFKELVTLYKGQLDQVKKSNPKIYSTVEAKLTGMVVEIKKMSLGEIKAKYT